MTSPTDWALKPRAGTLFNGGEVDVSVETIRGGAYLIRMYRRGRAGKNKVSERLYPTACPAFLRRRRT